MKEHSERIPEKNFKILHNKPFFYFIADTLKSTGLFKNLVINTDCLKICELAKERYGDWAIIIERPEYLRGDHVPMNKVIAYDISVIGSENDFMQTHSTNPFLSTRTILSAAKLYSEGKKSNSFDSLFAVNAIKTRLYDKDLNPVNHNPAILGRTQDLDVIYEENSNFYFFSGSSFLKQSHRIGENPHIYAMDRSSIESLDVDDLSDWIFAETLLNAGVVYS
jgi:N-acylneuraminate cytidylyltransferase